MGGEARERASDNEARRSKRADVPDKIAVERREAQRPGGGPRKPAIAGRARLGTGFATPS
jgi:hypothetical protein